MEMSGEHHAPAALLQERNSHSPCTGGLVDPRANTGTVVANKKIPTLADNWNQVVHWYKTGGYEKKNMNSRRALLQLCLAQKKNQILYIVFAYV
jgi:hypothetical protein